VARPLKEVLPPPEVLLDFEPEEIGVFLLEYLNSLGHADGQLLNRHNFTHENTLGPYCGGRYKEVAEAIIEGWIWLEREGLIGPRPGSQGEWIFITKRGRSLRTRTDFEAFKRGSSLPAGSLDPVLAQKVRSLFLRGDYEAAVFQAFKEVEVRVRTAAKLPAEAIGVDLMRRAFDAEAGPLADKTQVIAERKATSHLFAGAVGLFKNPTSHRKVEIGPEEASELIHLANHLLRIVDSRTGSAGEGTNLVGPAPRVSPGTGSP
jgi:uncharacterized protein (TIGR02391 family)